MFYSVSQEQFIEGLNVKIAQNVVRGLSAWRKILYVTRLIFAQVTRTIGQKLILN